MIRPGAPDVADDGGSEAAGDDVRVGPEEALGQPRDGHTDVGLRAPALGNPLSGGDSNRSLLSPEETPVCKNPHRRDMLL